MWQLFWDFTGDSTVFQAEVAQGMILLMTRLHSVQC